MPNFLPWVGSVQYSDEWVAYSNIVSKINQPVIHIRGNHDAFNEPTYAESYFVKHGGTKVARNLKYEIKKSFGSYSFIAVDAASEPGWKRPFNFVGYIKDEGVKELENLGKETKANNQSIWFGHYPTSSKKIFLTKIFCDF